MSKRMKAIFSENDFSQSQPLDSAVDTAIKTSTTKFNETIDICLNLNIDPKNGEQNVRGKMKLPKGLGKKITVCVFAGEDKQQEAKDAGADIVGSDDLIEKIANGKFDFIHGTKELPFLPEWDIWIPILISLNFFKKIINFFKFFSFVLSFNVRSFTEILPSSLTAVDSNIKVLAPDIANFAKWK